MPAIGPSQRDIPDGAAAAAATAGLAGSAAPGCAGITGCAAAFGAVAGAACGATLWRCAPRLPPPPSRLASASVAEGERDRRGQCGEHHDSRTFSWSFLR